MLSAHNVDRLRAEPHSAQQLPQMWMAGLVRVRSDRAEDRTYFFCARPLYWKRQATHTGRHVVTQAGESSDGGLLPDAESSDFFLRALPLYTGASLSR